MDGNNNEIRPDEGASQPEQAPPPEPVGEGVPWAGILFLLWAVLLIIFSVQNADSTTVTFLTWSWQLPVALVVLITALITLVIAGLGSFFYRRRRRHHRQLRRAARRSGE